MQIITLLNQCYRFPGFVYQQVSLSPDGKRLEIRVRPGLGSKAFQALERGALAVRRLNEGVA